MRLNELKPANGSGRNKKRVGRGLGSGTGKTSGRGQKGQKSRSGARSPRGFEGGQMPLQRRLPKVGFTNIFKKRYALIKVGDLSKFEAGAVIDRSALVEAGLIKKLYDGVKVLSDGDIAHTVTLRVDKVSKSAQAKIEAAGGKVETAEGKVETE